MNSPLHRSPYRPRQLISDRETLHAKVTAAIHSELAEQGFQIDLIKISDITTPGSNYLTDMGRAEAAKAAQEASVAEAQARLTSETEQIKTEEQIAARNRDLELRKAEIQVETDTANAKAAAAGRLAAAEQDRRIAVEEQKALVEKAKATDAQFDIDVRRPAEASKYADVQRAEAERDAANAAAEADAFRRTQIAEANKTASLADAAAKKAEGQAAADVRRAQGQAEAEAVRAVGLAQAEATKKQAEALAQQGQAVLVQQLITVLPQVVEAAAKPIAGIDNLTVVSTDGASALTRTVGSTVAEGAGLLGALAPGLGLEGLLDAVTGRAVVDKPEQTPAEQALATATKN